MAVSRPASICLILLTLGYPPLVLVISSCPFSDHYAVSFNVNMPAVVPPGPGIWKLNVSILTEDEYVDLITNFWTNWHRCQNSFSSLAELWDFGKFNILGAIYQVL